MSSGASITLPGRTALLGVLATGMLALSISAAVLAKPSSRDIALVLDGSTRVAETDPTLAGVESLTRFVAALEEEDTRVGLILFGERAQLSLPLAEHGLDEASVSDTLTALTFEESQSNAAAGLERALYELQQHGRADAVPTIVLLMAGELETGDSTLNRVLSRWMVEDLADEAAEAGIRVYGLGLSEAVDYQILQALAEKTGGASFRATEATETESALTQIAALIADAPEVDAAVAQVTAPPEPAEVPELLEPEPPRVQADTPSVAATPDTAETTTPTAPPTQQEPAADQRTGGLRVWLYEHAALLLIAVGAVAMLVLAGLWTAVRWRRRPRRGPTTPATAIRRSAPVVTAEEDHEPPTLMHPRHRPPRA